MWRLLIGCLCIGHICWAQPQPSASFDSSTRKSSPPDNMITDLTSNLEITFKVPVKPSSCKEVKGSARLVKAVLSNGAEVLCDTRTDNGGWTIFQRRFDGSQSFFLNFSDYINGFGKLDGEFWMSLKLLHEFTYKRCYELRVDLMYKNDSRYALYSYFKVYGPEDNYQLKIGDYSGDAGDALTYHDEQQFSTKDKDNDERADSCAERFYGAWWYKACHRANLNGEWGSTTFGRGLNWQPLTGFRKSVTSSEMKIRPCP